MSYRWPTMPDTGAAGVAGAVGDIGAEIGKLGETLNKIQAENQLAKFTAETAKIDNDLAYQLEQETDSTKYEKMVANADAKKERLVPSNGLAARYARRSLEVQKADSHKLLLESMLRREKLTREARIEAERRSIVINVGEEVIGIEDSAQASQRFNELIKTHQLTYNEQSEIRGRMAASKVVQKEAKEDRDNEITNEIVTKLQEMDPDTVTYINKNVEDAIERDKWLERFKKDSERRLRGENIINNENERGRLLDLAASIAWPERQVKIADVLRQANIARYDEEIIDNAAYNEVRDAIRSAVKDEYPFSEAQIERAIGSLMTGATYDIMGKPLPDMLRTREDHLNYARTTFGRFATRIPGVMQTINAKFPPPAENNQVETAPSNPAYDYDGESIGYYNEDGSITLNKEGQKRLFEIAGNDAEKAREMALEQRYIIPTYQKKLDPESWEVWIRAMENRK